MCNFWCLKLPNHFCEASWLSSELQQILNQPTFDVLGYILYNIYNPTKMGYDNLPINLVQDFCSINSRCERMSRSDPRNLVPRCFWTSSTRRNCAYFNLHYIPTLLLLCHVLSMSYAWWIYVQYADFFLASRLWVVISVSWWTSLVAV